MCQTYKGYLDLHANLSCRRMHVFGLAAGVLWTIAALADLDHWWRLLLAPVPVYLFAWTGHWLFAGNHPPTFHDPPRSVIVAVGYFCRMMWEIARGKVTV